MKVLWDGVVKTIHEMAAGREARHIEAGGEWVFQDEMTPDKMKRDALALIGNQPDQRLVMWLTERGRPDRPAMPSWFREAVVATIMLRVERELWMLPLPDEVVFAMMEQAASGR
jgi:hypothetical protein